MDKELADGAPLGAVHSLIMGFRTTQLLHVAAKLGIADLLKEEPQDAAALAKAVGAHPRALYRLMRALASLGIFAETGDGRFQLTALADTLRSDVPGSLRDLAVLYGAEYVWHAYGGTLYSVTSGLPAFDKVYGQTLYDYLNLHPEAAAAFDRGMTGYSQRDSAEVLHTYDFSAVSTAVDVGGGQGGLLAAILRAHPHVHGVLFDQSAVIVRARKMMTDAGIADRCVLTSGNFFDAVPHGGDLYLLKSVLRTTGTMIEASPF